MGRGREVPEGEYLWLMHADVWQKPRQYCKAIILQLKMHYSFKKYNTITHTNKMFYTICYATFCLEMTILKIYSEGRS